MHVGIICFFIDFPVSFSGIYFFNFDRSSNMNLYPLKFEPILKERIWGGSKLLSEFNKSGATERTGESWELSACEGDESVVSNGFLAGNTLSELTEVYMGELVGDTVYEHYGLNFPLLFKLIDARDKLSIQVHPDDEIAAERHNSFGKTEMWYIMDADPGAELIVGFSNECSPEKYAEAIQNDNVEALLGKVPVKKGDVIFIPAGLVHAIGEGIVVAEIQQTSDITYRIYDFNRTDDKGNRRQLHIDDALGVINFSAFKEPKIIYKEQKNMVVPLVSCEYFSTNLIKFDKQIIRNYGDIDSFKVYICAEGDCSIFHNDERTYISKGQTVLVPACISGVTFEPETETTLLEVFAGNVN